MGTQKGRKMIPVNPQNINQLSAREESPGRAMCHNILRQRRNLLQHEESLPSKFARKVRKIRFLDSGNGIANYIIRSVLR